MSERHLSFDEPNDDAKSAVRSLISLYGILWGVVCDGVVSPGEVEFFRNWRDQHRRSIDAVDPTSRPLFEKLNALLAGATLTFDEAFSLYRDVDKAVDDRADVSRATVAVQLLSGFLQGIAADSVVDEREKKRLADWLASFSRCLGQDPAFDALYESVKLAVASGEFSPDFARRLVERRLDFVAATNDAK